MTGLIIFLAIGIGSALLANWKIRQWPSACLVSAICTALLWTAVATIASGPDPFIGLACCFAFVYAFIIAYVIAIPFRIHRRRAIPRPPTQCETCDYDLTGNVSGRCPECGTPLSAAARNALRGGPVIDHE